MTKTPKRRSLSPLMSAMGSRVEDLSESFISGQSNLNHSFEVSTESLEADESQPRKRFSQRSLEELRDSLILHGQLTPLLVRPKEGHRGRWIIVAGERRWRAAKLAGIQTLLAIERTADHEVASLIENLQREDLTPLEEAHAISEICKQKGWSQREAAKQLGRAVSDINGVIGILRLPQDFLDAVLKSEHPLSRNLLIELARVSDGVLKQKLLPRALAGTLSIPEIRKTSAAITDKKKAIDDKPISKKSRGFVPSVKNVNTVVASLKDLDQSTLDASQRDALTLLVSTIKELLASST